MTAPTTLLNLMAPAPAAPATSAGSVRPQGADHGAAPFSDVMARQRAAQDDSAASSPKDARGTQDAKPASPPVTEDGKPAAGADADKQDDKDITADADAGQPTLAQQALEMAAMMVQLQAAPVAPAAAGTTDATGSASSATATGDAQILPAMLSASGAAVQAAAGDASKTTSADDKSGIKLPAGFVGVAANADHVADDASTATAAGAAATQQTGGVLAGSQNKTQADARVASKTADAQRRTADLQALGDNAQNDNSHVDARTAANGGSGDSPLLGASQPIEVHPGTARADASTASGDANAAQISAAQNTLASALAGSSQVPVSFRQAAATAGPQVSTPVGHAQWGDDLGRQMVVMSNNLQQNSHTAELRLDPPDLGPLRVTITLSDGVAQASFVSSHAAVRQAVESALPQLQQALSQAGISLGQTSVGDQGAQAGFASFNQGSGRQGQPGGQGGSSQGDAGVESIQVTAQARRANDALVDTFA